MSDMPTSLEAPLTGVSRPCALRCWFDGGLISWPPPRAALPVGASSPNGSVSVRGRDLHDLSDGLDGTSSELSFGIRWARRLSPRPKPGLFSLGVGGLSGVTMAKLPKFPIVALLGAALQGDAGPVLRILPVLLRTKPPRDVPVLESSARSSDPSLKSIAFREWNDGSSLENLPVPAGEPRPVTESPVCCRRVLGLLDAGEESPNVPGI
jgi:hypothetical protein